MLNCKTMFSFLQMYFEGYGNFFGIEASAYINITMSALEIYVWGKAWNLVYAELYISASYDVTDFKNAHFYVRVIVDMRKLTDVSSMFFIYLMLDSIFLLSGLFGHLQIVFLDALSSEAMQL